MNAARTAQTIGSHTGSAMRAPNFSRPPAATQQVTPPASVQETLRNIEENAARWTTIAGASLARRGGPEVVRYTTDPSSSPSTDDKTMDDGRIQSATLAQTDAPSSVQNTVDTPAAHARPESQPPHESLGLPEVPPTADHSAVATLAELAANVAPVEASVAPAQTPNLEAESGLVQASESGANLTVADSEVLEADASEVQTTNVGIPAASVLAAESTRFDQPDTFTTRIEAPLPRSEHATTIERVEFATPAAPDTANDGHPDAQTGNHGETLIDTQTAAQDHVQGEAPTGTQSEGRSTTSPNAASPAEPSLQQVMAPAAPVEPEAPPRPQVETEHVETEHIETKEVETKHVETEHAEPEHTEPEHVDPPHVELTPAPTPTPSNVVRFPGFAASTVARAESTVSEALPPAGEESPVTHSALGTSLYALAESSTTVEEVQQPDDASDYGDHDAPVNSGIHADPFPIVRHEPANEPVAPRPPVTGHAPTVFEFHAPAASMVELPTLDLLAPADTDVEPVSEERLAETGQLIEQRLQEFKVPVTVVGASAGPVITRFEVEPALGVRGSQIVGLMKDLSRGLGLTSIRVVETIPGKTCMGLELPNAKRQTIRLSEILEANVYQHSHSMLTLAMGKDITGHPVVADLAKAPHMLVAGTTGSGKSVAINAMIVSLLYKATPEDVRLIMIDPKMLELSVYEGIPHLLAPVVTDMKLAANALNWCVGEMEKRYRLMSAVGVRNLAGFNQKIRDAEAAGKKLGNPFSLTPEAPEPLAALPLIVVVIDELADLMMVAGKKIEELIARLAQKARAAGIHLILATQRPSVDVITGLIKANIPTRVAFQVSSKIDSRTILDQMGAESLLGQGDMLFLPPGTGYPQRVHGAFVADEEVHRIVEYLKQFGEPQYEEGILDGPATEGAAQDLFGETPDAEADPLYDEAVAFVVRTRRASISSVQRQLRIGYNRAARLVEQMEAAGLVSSMGVNGSREVLAPGPAE